MRKMCLLFSLLVFSSFALVSIHAAQFGFDDHDHHGQECQIDDCFFNPAIDNASAPSIALQLAEYSQAPSFHPHLISLLTHSHYTPRAPPFFV